MIIFASNESEFQEGRGIILEPKVIDKLLVAWFLGHLGYSENSNGMHHLEDYGCPEFLYPSHIPGLMVRPDDRDRRTFTAIAKYRGAT